MTQARSRRRFVAGAAAVVLAAALAVPSRAAVQVDASISLEAAHSPRSDIDVWTNKEEGGVYRQGEPMRVFFRPSADAYVLIYNIDTEGYIHLVYPYGPDDPEWLEGGRTYQVPSRNDPYDLVADGPTGIEYVVAIASPTPFRDLPWYLTGRADARPDEYEGDEEYEDSGVIVGDPYVAMDRIVRRVVPRGHEDEVATADTYFYIERRVEYPRYVCADCHSYRGWYDPYGDICSVVSIRIDAGWAHYRPLRWRVLRPRYFYMVRSSAPTRYRQWKERWSSVDGRSTLRTRFQVDGTDKFRSRRQTIQRRTPPEFQNLRRSRTGRVWRRDEVIRRSDETRRDRGDTVRERGDARPNDGTRRREALEQRERRQSEQRQSVERRREELRRMQDRRREDRRIQQREERRDPERRPAVERRREEQRQDRRDRDRARSRENDRRDDRREQARQREERSQDRGNRGREVREDRDRGRSDDRGRSESRERGDDRRRDDGDRGRGRR